MGGRLDSTNVVHPVLSVITSISFDHTRQLGNTLGAIATEKAGILKRSRPAVSGVCEDEPRQAIRRVAAQRRCPLRELGIDFRFQAIPPRPPLSRPTPGGSRSRPGGPTGASSSCPCSGPTRRTTRRWRWRGSTSWPSWSPARGRPRRRRPGLRRAALAGPGRGAGRVALAGDRRRAQRRLGRGAGRDAPRPRSPPPPRTLVFGTTRDKDLPGQLRALLPLFDTVIATRYVENPRSVPAEDVAAAVVALDGRTARVDPRAGRGPGAGPPADRPGRADLRDRLAVPGRRGPGDRPRARIGRRRHRGRDVNRSRPPRRRVSPLWR